MRKSIARASVNFGLRGDANPETGDLIIENERLKNSIAIFTGKLKSQEDYQAIIEDLRKKNKLLDDENALLKS